MRIRVFFSPCDRKVQSRQKLCNEAFLPHDAPVRKQRVLADLLIIGHTFPRVFLILVIRHGTLADEFCPIFDMIPFVDEMVAMPKCLGERRCINQEFAFDEVKDSDLGLLVSRRYPSHLPFALRPCGGGYHIRLFFALTNCVTDRTSLTAKRNRTRLRLIARTPRDRMSSNTPLSDPFYFHLKRD